MITKLLILFVAVLILLVTHNWFLPGYLAGYDSLFYFKESYLLYSLYPYAWSTFREAGMGGSYIPLLWGYASNGLAVTLFGSMFGFSWQVIDRIAFYIPFLLLAVISSWQLARKTLVDNTFAVFAGLVYTINSYILMVMSGGQVHFGLAYAIAPFVLWQLISLVNQFTVSEKHIRIKSILFSSLITGLFITMQAMLDLRVTYVVMVIAFIYILLNIRVLIKNPVKILIPAVIYAFIIPLLVTASLLAYWIIPVVMVGGNPVEQLGAGYTQDNSVKFFSFAMFENAMGLMHPNWPDNIFGKVGFMKAEFLLLPILAFVSLLFINPKNKLQNNYLLFFALVAIIGIFFAKGANDPFGNIYFWMIDTVPGFSAFRDPTKWYILIAIAYSVLIPFTIEQVFGRLTKKFNKTK